MTLVKSDDKTQANFFFSDQYKLSIISKSFTKSLSKIENIWKNENVIYYAHGSISIDLENFFLLFKKSAIFSSYQLGKLIKNVGGNDFLPRKLNLIKKLRDLFDGKLNKFTIKETLARAPKVPYISIINTHTKTIPMIAAI